MAEKIHANHGRDHLPGGSDPIPGVAITASARFTAIVFGRDEAVAADAFARDGFSFTLPSDLDGLTVVDVEAFVQTPSTSGAVEIAVYRFYPDLDGSGVSRFTTNLTIDQDEFTSLTAATPVAIDTSSGYDAGDYVVIEVEDAGTGTLGLGVHLTFGPPT